jgi:hyperosmotically inducible protein
MAQPCVSRALIAAATLAAALGGCTRTEDGVRIETERAAEETQEALEKAGAEVERGAEAFERHAQPLVEDAAVTAKVKAKLTADPEVDAFDIDVDTVAGVVTLSGTVESAALSAEAEKLARGTSGVREVVNRLTVQVSQSG